MAGRLSLGTLTRDHWRSLRVYGTGAADASIRYLLVVMPVAAGLASAGLGFRLTDPAAVLPAVSLLSGALLASAGQFLSLRARIADSVVLSGNQRLRGIFREAISGVLIAAMAAFFTAVLMGILALLPSGAGHPVAQKLGLVVTAVTAGSLVLLVLMFISTIRRFYLTYLEAFEGGAPVGLEPPSAVAKADIADELDEDADELRALGIPVGRPTD